MSFFDHVHIDYVLSYAFQYQGVGGRVSLCLSFVENSTFALPVLLPTRGLFHFLPTPEPLVLREAIRISPPLRVERVTE